MIIRVQFCLDKNEIISKWSIYSVASRTALFELLDKIHSGIVYFLFSLTTRQFYLLQKKKLISPSVHIHCIAFPGRLIFLFVFIYSYVYARKLFYVLCWLFVSLYIFYSFLRTVLVMEN